MAKDKKKDKAPKEEPKTETKKDKTPEFKFGVSDLAEQMGIKEASVRVQLRNKGIEKAGKSYGWNTAAELKEVAGQLKSPKEDAKEEAKPDKKAKKPKKGEEPAPAPEPEGKKKKDKKNKG